MVKQIKFNTSNNDSLRILGNSPSSPSCSELASLSQAMAACGFADHTFYEAVCDYLTVSIVSMSRLSMVGFRNVRLATCDKKAVFDGLMSTAALLVITLETIASVGVHHLGVIITTSHALETLTNLLVYDKDLHNRRASNKIMDMVRVSLTSMRILGTLSPAFIRYMLTYYVYECNLAMGEQLSGESSAALRNGFITLSSCLNIMESTESDFSTLRGAFEKISPQMTAADLLTINQ